MRTFIALATIFIISAIYTAADREPSWSADIGMVLMMLYAVFGDYVETRKRD